MTFSHLNVEPTKRGILQKSASCDDPVGLANSILLVGKSIYQNCSELGVFWDQLLPEVYWKKWIKGETCLPPTIIVPRVFQLHQEKIEANDPHMLGDVSITRAAAAIYAVIYKLAQVSKGLVTAKV